MRHRLDLRIASVLAGSLLLLGPAVARAADAPPHAARYIVLADSSEFESKKQAYLDKAHAEFDEWGRKISAWSDQAKAKGSNVSEAARREMDEA
jgi:hypothetical protein